LLKSEEYGKWIDRFLEYCNETIERPPGMALVRDISLVKNKEVKKGEAGVTKI